MAIRDFDLSDDQSFQRVTAHDLPNLGVIAGPNGAGKSRLLYKLWTERSSLAESGTTVAYIAPHRGWRPTTVSTFSLSQFQPTFGTYLEQQAIPQFRVMPLQGVGLDNVEQGGARIPTGVDDSFAFVKSSIIKIDFALSDRLRQVWDEQGHAVPPGAVPEVFRPLTIAIQSLLPHLTFETVDRTEQENLRVIFRRVDGQRNSTVEFDQLSSGERAAVSLVLPTVEIEMTRILRGEPATEPAEPVPTTLIDEPELHLHPSLQVLWLDYISGLARRNVAQFIVATHSPTIVDALAEGLYLLAPVSQVPDGNQLVPLTRSSEKLEAMRALTGATHVLTRCRPVVYVEGERPSAKPMSDQRLVEILIPDATGWVVVAAKGQGEVVSKAGQLREALAETMPGLPVFALVDSDQKKVEHPDWVVSWPLSMVENLLLDASAIWEVLKAHRETVSLSSAAEVEAALRAIAEKEKAEETRLRVELLKKAVTARVRPSDESDLHDAVKRARDVLDEQLGAIDPGGDLLTQWQAAEASVAKILERGDELKLFRGKPIFEKFYKEHAQGAGMSKRAFGYAVAEVIAGRPEMRAVVEKVSMRIARYVPSDLVVAASELQPLVTPPNDATIGSWIQSLVDARQAWDDDKPLPVTGEALREAAVSLARTAEENGQSELATRIRTGAASLAPGSPANT